METNKRKFLKKAAISAPIVIASSAKPAWGMDCLSGMMSGNLSNHTHTCDVVSGLSSSFWKESFVGNQDIHYKKNDPSSNILKRKFKNYDGRYCVRIGRTYYFSDKGVESYFGNTTCQYGLTSSDEFMCEIITARINASIPQLHYVYSIADVEQLYSMVIAGTANEGDIVDILKQVHSG